MVLTVLNMLHWESAADCRAVRADTSSAGVMGPSSIFQRSLLSDLLTVRRSSQSPVVAAAMALPQNETRSGSRVM